MKRAFIDSSVLFSAAYSPRGAARALILEAARMEIELVISPLVWEETRRNLAKSAPQVLGSLTALSQAIPFEWVKPSSFQIRQAARRMVWKDAPILAAARKAGVEFLVTSDKKHLLGRPELARYAHTAIITPEEVIRRIRLEKIKPGR